MESGNTPSLWLEAAGEGDRIKIGVHQGEAPTIRPYKAIPVSLKTLESRCQQMIEQLNAASRKRGDPKPVMEKLKEMGRFLCDDLLPPEIKSTLARSESEYLILNLDDHLVHIPWELLWIGEGFLCQRFRMGRLVRTQQQFADIQPRKRSAPLRMWILANPGNDLASATTESFSISGAMDGMNTEEETRIDTQIQSRISAHEVREQLKSYDFVHFAGHADFTPQAPDQSGWRLSQGSFQAADVHKMMGGAAMPFLVFSNACQSARTQAWNEDGDTQDSLFGLANAFMLAGVRHYIGTSWDITDEPSSRFAEKFYRYLLSGQTTGQAVHQARLDLIAENNDLCWASYILYGDPREGYFDPADELPEQKQGEPSVPVIPVSRDEARTWASARTAETASALGQTPAKGKTDEPVGQPIIHRISRGWGIWGGLVLALVIGILAWMLPPDSEDDWTAQPMNIAVKFDAPDSVMDAGRARLVSAALESAIMSEGRFKVLERGTALYQAIIPEYELWTDHIAPEKRPQKDFLPATLICDFAVPAPETVLMQLSVTTRTQIQGIFEQTLDYGQRIFSQKQALAWELITALRALYPVRGKIIEIADNRAILNIGAAVGVGYGQRFDILDPADVMLETTLETVSVKPDQATARILYADSASPLSEGLRVIRHYPIQGKIIRVLGRELELDIGNRDGVWVGQRFQVIAPNRQTVLKITAKREQTSVARPESGDTAEKGWIVEAM